MGPQTRDLYERMVWLLMSWHALECQLHDFGRWFAPTGPKQLQKSSKRESLKAEAERIWEEHLTMSGKLVATARQGA